MSPACDRKPAPPVIGMETEYALFLDDRRGDVGPWYRRELHQRCLRLLSCARQAFPALPDRTGHGLFLGNGSRFYIDAGHHPEYSTPECSNPFELVRHALAGDRIVERLCRMESARVVRRRRTLCASRSNVCYEGTGRTWGCHESYRYFQPREVMLPALIPHLVTRICYTGAGGFRATTPAKGEFLISPRVQFLQYLESPESTSSRGVLHTKDEPLSDERCHRLHLLCGEALCSQWAQVLKLGTTSLLVSLLDAGVIDTSRLALETPLQAMHALAGDLDGSVRVSLEDGRKLRAVEIQRELLEMVETHLDRVLLGDWAATLCGYWHRALELLDKDPDAAAVVFDWAIKLALFREYGGQRPVLTPKLAEIDFRFAALGDSGIFEAFDEAETLAHRIPEVGDVESATAAPSSLARPQLRGELVRRLAGNGDRYVCDWLRVVDLKERRSCTMPTPYAGTDAWRSVRPRGDFPESVWAEVFDTP